MPRMALYHQINDYFEVFELFFTVFHCFFTFYRIFDTGYWIPNIRPDIRWVILSGPSLIMGILVIFDILKKSFKMV